MKKLLPQMFFYAVSMTILVCGLVFYLIRQADQIRHQRALATAKERSHAKGYAQGKANQDAIWQHKLPGIVDSAYQAGVTKERNQWQTILPTKLDSAHQAGYRQGVNIAEAACWQHIADTTLAMQTERLVFGEHQHQVGYQQRMKEEISYAYMRKVDAQTPRWLHTLVNDPSNRWAWAMLAFGMAFLLIRWLVRSF